MHCDAQIITWTNTLEHLVFSCGRNTFAFPNPDIPTEIAVTLDIATRLLDSRQPSRMLILLPQSIEHKFMTIAHSQNTSIFKDCKSGAPLTLALVINKESMSGPYKLVLHTSSFEGMVT